MKSPVIFRVTGHLCGKFTIPGEYPAQRPVTRSFDVFFDLRLNKRFSKLCEAGDLRHNSPYCDVIVMDRGGRYENITKHNKAWTVCTFNGPDAQSMMLAVTVTTHDHHQISNHRKLDFLLHTFLSITTIKTSKLLMTNLFLPCNLIFWKSYQSW